MQFVLPKAYRRQALLACHNEVGHLGQERSLELLQEQFYWPYMSNGMEQHIKTCTRCLQFKARPQKEEMTPILATYPLELVHIDFLTIESVRQKKDINVLVMTDHFTCHAQAFVTPSQTAPVVARTLWEKYFTYYGFPDKLISNQGCNFESDLIAELCKLSQIKKLHTTPYRPQGNGQCK